MTSKHDAVKRTLVASALVLSQSLLLSPRPALADSDVRVAGQTVFSIPSAATTLSADTIQNNLDNALVAAKDKSPAGVSIVYAKGMPVVTLGGYQVVTIDAASGTAAGTSPALLANKWADALKASLADQSSVQSYVAQLSGGGAAAPAAPSYSAPAQAAMGDPSQAGGYQPVQYNPGGGTYAQTPPPSYGAPQYGQPPQYGQVPQYGQAPYGQPPQYGAPNGYRQGRVAYAPAGLVIPLQLQTSIATNVAKAGDMIQAQISQAVTLGDSSIPAGSTVTGTVTDAEAGRRLSRSGSLQIKFTKLRTPDGVETPISGHLIGGIDKYKTDAKGDLRGEGWKAKAGQTVIRGGAGAGLGAALGTAVGAIAGRSGRATGAGAWSGAAIGGGVGMADMLVRKGRDVVIPSGTQMQLQLDSPATVAGGGFTGNL
jgi:hypothetical protein